MRPSKLIFVLLVVIVVVKAMIDISLRVYPSANKRDREELNITITVSKPWAIMLPEKFLEQL